MNSEENPSWDYKPGQDTAVQTAQVASGGSAANSFSWTAAEYIEHRPNAGWYLIMLFILVAVAAGTYFITKDYFAVGATIAAVLIAVVYARRRPKQVTYELTSRNLNIGQKKYAYSLFKSFSIFHEGELSSINFMPIKRLMPPVSIYCTPQDEQKIISLVGEHLPYEEHKLDVFDRLTQRLHL